MITREDLIGIVKLQKEELKQFGYGVEREKAKELKLNLQFALILSGVRRSGKSTLMRQLMKKVKGPYYFNFEDPRVINFEVSDFQKLDEVFRKLYDKQEYYFFDEIQNVPKWELFVRRLVDSKKNVIITGSNASLLSKELGTRLTGRHLTYEIFPFSYKEFLYFTKEKQGIDSFNRYLFDGGFPEYLRVHFPNLLQDLLKDIIARDIVTRHKVRNVATLNAMAIYLITNIGKEFSYNALKKLFKLGSINSIISFVSYFEDSYLLFTVPRFDYSMKKRIVFPKKIYCIDNGLASKNSTSFSQDKGRMLENLVFITLRRNKRDEIYYFKENRECDFVVRNGHEIAKAIQVCYDFNDDNKDREIEGLQEAMTRFKLKEGLILTYNQEDEFKIGHYAIKVKPVWKWLLSKD